MAYTIIAEDTFSGMMSDKDTAYFAYQKRLDDVKQTISADRLLTFDVSEGWRPLCSFFNLPEPQSHPHAETSRMMVATIIRWRQAALRVDRAAEFASPDDQRIVQHAAPLEIFEQRIAGLIDVLTLAGHPSVDVAMVVPVVVIDLNKTHAPFGHSSRH